MKPIRPHASEPPRPPRILLYSHDSYGLGHLRRSLNIAGALTERLPGAQVLVASGSPCATHFALPEGVDVVKLPSVTKDAGGAYVPRSLGGSLDGTVELRGRILLETFRAFAPNVLLVDHQVLGLNGELAPVLDEAALRGTRTVLGIRDVIDAPETVAREWGLPRVRRALDRQYDRVCVYGTPEIFDPRVEYPVPPELGRRIEFVGYVVRPEGAAARRALPRLRQRVLVTVGGGQDGAETVSSYLDMLERRRPEWDSTIVLGPLLAGPEARQLKRRARLLERVQVSQYHSDIPRLLAESDAVVSMAGYNSVAEILQSGKPAVLCPRVFPRREQLIRSERLARRGLATVLVQPGAQELLTNVRSALQRGPSAAERPPLDGHRRVCEVVASLLSPAVSLRNGAVVA